ncbi:TonB-dependent receptor [Flavobacterium magnum]|uniref:TonB-dependent receptor n=2 Tax=Flavobacterium magnum TaxID=2162713 RepID=A0A2S0RII2_9FLAO|nr:TonB-dependent receptor [Flavobacterium magnum]
MDFNTISGSDFNTIVVRGGGGSVLYGSSAIGGAISLNNEVVFGKSLSQSVRAAYGSFNTAALAYRLQFGTKKFSLQTGFSANASSNDYRNAGHTFENRNGQFRNLGFNANAGYQFGANDFIKFHTRLYEGGRHFALISPSDSKTKYRDSNSWYLLEWDHFAGRFISRSKIALLREHYQYYEDIQNADYTFGKLNTLNGRYDLTFNLNEKIRLNGIADFTQHAGWVSSLVSQKRQIASGSLLLAHRISERLQYELGFRKEITDNYDSPLLFSFGTLYRISEKYKLKGNVSKNFRIPTFNDLYWDGLGNPDLHPETAVQVEIGQEITVGHCSLSITAYHSDIQDMIRWVPRAGGVFSPENTDKVKINGIETACRWNTKINTHTLEANLLYAYNQSENAVTGKQLVYVPFHKITASAGYGFRRWSFTVQHLFTDKVYTQTDNNPARIVPYYNVTDAALAYDFGRKDHLKLGCHVRNLWNENYQSVEGRYMPQRNIDLYLTLKF